MHVLVPVKQFQDYWLSSYWSPEFMLNYSVLSTKDEIHRYSSLAGSVKGSQNKELNSNYASDKLALINTCIHTLDYTNYSKRRFIFVIVLYLLLIFEQNAGIFIILYRLRLLAWIAFLSIWLMAASFQRLGFWHSV